MCVGRKGDVWRVGGIRVTRFANIVFIRIVIAG